MSTHSNSHTGALRARRRAIPAIALLALALLLAATAARPQSEPRLLLEARETGPDAPRPAFEGSTRREERDAMVAGQIEAREVRDQHVLDAMRRVPRHEFVPERAAGRAYADTPLPIGHGQTISQPFIVAFMTELLDLEPSDRVLEIGTGSAYQAAILAEIAGEVVTIEIIEPLAAGAARRLERLGYDNVTVLHGDGYYGYEQAAPFDAIIVTAAASHVPPPLLAQLRPGGRIAIPVGRAWAQNLLLVEKDAEGGISSRNLMAVRFVPLTGGH